MTFKDAFPYVALIVSAILMPIIWHLVKKYEAKTAETAKLKKEVETVTNQNLLDKMNDLCEKQDVHQEVVTRRFDKVESNIETLHDKTNKLALSVATLKALREAVDKRTTAKS